MLGAAPSEAAADGLRLCGWRVTQTIAAGRCGAGADSGEYHMAAEHQTLRHHGLYVDRDPLAEDATTGGPPEQSQDWPGSDQAMRPQADHGEHTRLTTGSSGRS